MCQQPSDAQAQSICLLKQQVNIWNCLPFLNKHLISLKGPFSSNSVKISDCPAFTWFETMPGCRTFSHYVKKKLLTSKTVASLTKEQIAHIKYSHWSAAKLMKLSPFLTIEN